MVALRRFTMKKITYKDRIIILGIAVAIVLILFSIHFKENTLLNQNNSGNPSLKRISPTALITKTIKALRSKTVL